jgi:hypothetical protein
VARQGSQLARREITGYGTEFIHIDEVVETATFGPVAIYRHWIENPDGDEVRNSFTPSRAEHLFRPVDKLAGALD